jgi:hypothetical protein
MLPLLATFPVLLLFVTSAIAQTAPGPFPPPQIGQETRVVRRYGWQILVTDLGVITASAVLGSASEDTGSGMFAAGYFLGGPAVHIAHGNPGRALGSAIVRISLPVLGALAGVSTANCYSSDDWFCGVGHAAYGGLIGMAAAVAIDAGLLAREERAVSTQPARAPRGLRAAPDLRLSEGALSVGLRGTF